MDNLDLTVKIGWRRQHPEFENLFWCPACGQYKDRGEFGVNKSRCYGLSGACRQCRAIQRYGYYRRNKEGFCKWKAANFDKEREHSRKWRASNRERVREYGRKSIANLSDHYIKDQLRLRNLPITPETIELKRAHIQMKRTLKEFKKWNEENLKQEGGI